MLSDGGADSGASSFNWLALAVSGALAGLAGPGTRTAERATGGEPKRRHERLVKEGA